MGSGRMSTVAFNGTCAKRRSSRPRDSAGITNFRYCMWWCGSRLMKGMQMAAVRVGSEEKIGLARDGDDLLVARSNLSPRTGFCEPREEV